MFKNIRAICFESGAGPVELDFEQRINSVVTVGQSHFEQVFSMNIVWWFIMVLQNQR